MVGDSFNDESLFEESKFFFLVGVVNIFEYVNKINYQLVYVISKKEVEGFCELVELILSID